jgi:hypothetical protein
MALSLNPELVAVALPPAMGHRRDIAKTGIAARVGRGGIAPGRRHRQDPTRNIVAGIGSGGVAATVGFRDEAVGRSGICGGGVLIGPGGVI